MKRYVIQSRKFDYAPWEVHPCCRYDTLEEAKAAFKALPFQHNHRVAEAYSVVRYKAVKGGTP